MGKLDRSLIAHFRFFEGITDIGLDAILEIARSARHPQNSVIFQQGDEARSFFFLLAGHVRAVRTTPDGQQVIAEYIFPGEVFGIAQAIGRSTYPASAIAAADCLTLSWPLALWDGMAQQYPQFATNTYKTIGNRLQDTQEHVVELVTEQAEQRVANALCRLMRQAGRKTDQGTVIDFPLSRRDLAEMSGTTLHTVGRMFSAWEERGIVKGGRQRVTIVNPQKLAIIASRKRRRN